MPPYHELYGVGTRVRIADRAALEEFSTTWRHHNPLSLQQLPFADAEAIVGQVSFYHGGDVLYQLVGIPGLWHEQCLRAGDGARAV